MTGTWLTLESKPSIPTLELLKWTWSEVLWGELWRIFERIGKSDSKGEGKFLKCLSTAFSNPIQLYSSWKTGFSHFFVLSLSHFPVIIDSKYQVNLINMAQGTAFARPIERSAIFPKKRFPRTASEVPTQETSLGFTMQSRAEKHTLQSDKQDCWLCKCVLRKHRNAMFSNNVVLTLMVI